VNVHIGIDWISCDVSAHSAWRIDGPNAPAQRWRVSWLPDRVLTRNEAITAITLAENYVDMAHTEHTALLASWAAELGLTLDAVTAALTGRSTP
jgi:hypothetical protein